MWMLKYSLRVVLVTTIEMKNLKIKTLFEVYQMLKPEKQLRSGISINQQPRKGNLIPYAKTQAGLRSLTITIPV